MLNNFSVITCLCKHITYSFKCCQWSNRSMNVGPYVHPYVHLSCTLRKHWNWQIFGFLILNTDDRGISSVYWFITGIFWKLLKWIYLDLTKINFPRRFSKVQSHEMDFSFKISFVYDFSLKLALYMISFWNELALMLLQTS